MLLQEEGNATTAVIADTQFATSFSVSVRNAPVEVPVAGSVSVLARAAKTLRAEQAVPHGYAKSRYLKAGNGGEISILL